MGSVYEELVDYAEALVNIINRKYLAGNSLAYLPLLSGIGNCKVESVPGAGHNYQAVIEAVHNCYREGLSTGYDVGYQEGITGMIRMAGSTLAVQGVVNVLFYELKLEKEGRAAFRIDSEKVIGQLNAVITEKRSVFEKENMHFAEWLERNSEYGREQFGVRIG